MWGTCVFLGDPKNLENFKERLLHVFGSFSGSCGYFRCEGASNAWPKILRSISIKMLSVSCSFLLARKISKIISPTHKSDMFIYTIHRTNMGILLQHTILPENSWILGGGGCPTEGDPPNLPLFFFLSFLLTYGAWEMTPRHEGTSQLLVPTKITISQQWKHKIPTVSWSFG